LLTFRVSHEPGADDEKSFVEILCDDVVHRLHFSAVPINAAGAHANAVRDHALRAGGSQSMTSISSAKD
jgi:hypothetical protein